MAKPYEQEVLLDADGKPLFDAVDRFASKIAGIQKTIEKMQTDSFSTVKNFSATLDANVKALQKAMGQMRTLQSQDANERRQQRALAQQDARNAVGASNGNTNSVAIGYQFEQEKALAALRAASTEKQRVAALQQVELANARLRAIQAIVREEDRLNRKQSTQTRTDDTSAQRARLMLSRQTAEQNVRNLGTENALTGAKERQVRAEQQLASATAVTRRERLQELEAANAELRATERLAAAQERAARAGARSPAVGGAGVPPKSPIQNILSPSYAGAAIARTAVYGGAAAAAYGAFNAAQQGFSGAVQIQDEFAKLQAISNSTDSEMKSLSGSILDVGKSSRFALTDIIKISETLAQAGVNASNMEPVLKSVLALATSSGSTPDEAVQLVTSALGAFNLQASESGRIADLMTEALNRTKLTVGQVGAAIQYVGTTAYEQNISLEQLLATIGSVAQAGVRSGSTIGTGFRQFLIDLQEPSKKLTEQLKNLGLTSADVDVSVRGLSAVLDTLAKAGFGSAQAYAGLETRAAAFYLTAKNNVDVADELQLAFAHSNASMIAQERAMDTLAAQWQRFKNILQESVSGGLQSLMTDLQNIIQQLGDRMQQMQNTVNAQKARQEQGRSAYAPGLGGTAKFVSEYNLEPAAEKVAQSILDLPYYLDKITGEGNGGAKFGTWLVNLDKDINGATDSSKEMAAQINKTNQEVETHRGTISELDHEIIRLITQKESLRNNDVRSAAETATLTTRFQGLSAQLVNTGNRYDDLVQAARRYRLEQSRLLGISLQTTINQNRVAAADDASRLTANARAAQGNQALMSALHPNERAALNVIQHASPGSQQSSQAYGLLSDALARLTRTGNSASAALNAVVTPAGDLANHVSAINTATPALGQINAQNTDFGQQILNAENTLTSLVEQLSSQPNGSKTKAGLTSQGDQIVNSMLAEIDRRLKGGGNDANAQSLRTAQSELKSFAQQLHAANVATDDETRATAKAQRDRERAERKAEAEARRGPPITQGDLDSALKTLAPGYALGRGQVSKEAEDALHRAGKTPATGNTSAHSTGIPVRDIPTGPMSKEDGDRLAQTIRQGLKNQFGVNFFVQFETGKGKNQGTGPHVHVNAPRGGAYKRPGTEDNADEAAAKFDTQTEQSQLELDRGDMAAALKDVSDAATKEAFDTSVAKAKAALEKVKADIANLAKDELANAGVGVGTPQYNAKMAQVAQEQQAAVEQFQDAMVKNIVKNSKAMLDAAQTAFERALAPSQSRLAVAQGMQTGLDRFSLTNRVPDSTRVAAQNATAQASEAADAARLAAIPARIAAQQAAINAAQATIADPNNGLDANHMQDLELHVEDLKKSMDDLQQTRDALAASFASGSLIPQTLGQSLQQAAANFNALNDTTGSFGHALIMNMGGAISSVQEGLTTMFDSIQTGTRGALGAFADFAKGIMRYISQMVAKIIATKIISLLFQLAGVGAGGGGGGAGAGSGFSMGPTSFGGVSMTAFNGKAIPGYYGGGGPIMKGIQQRDSSLARVAKGEWIVRRAAVQSVGHEFMNRLNRDGSKALNSTKDRQPIAVQAPPVSIPIYMIKPEEKPGLTSQDVLVTWQSDVLSGGQSKKLIQHVVRESQ